MRNIQFLQQILTGSTVQTVYVFFQYTHNFGSLLCSFPSDSFCHAFFILFFSRKRCVTIMLWISCTFLPVEKNQVVLANFMFSAHTQFYRGPRPELYAVSLSLSCFFFVFYTLILLHFEVKTFPIWNVYWGWDH